MADQSDPKIATVFNSIEDMAVKAEVWKQSGLDRDKYQLRILARCVSACFVGVKQMAKIGAAKQAAYEESRKHYRETNPLLSYGSSDESRVSKQAAGEENIPE